MQSRPFRKLSRAIRLKRRKRREAIQSDRLELYSSRSPPIRRVAGSRHYSSRRAAHGPQAVDDGRLHMDEALAALALHGPCALGQHRADGGIGGGRDGDPDHCGEVVQSAGLVDANWGKAGGAVVLRSFGKAYGLAGLRLGFAIASPDVGERLRAALGLWPVSGPAIAIGARAWRIRTGFRRWAQGSTRTSP